MDVNQLFFRKSNTQLKIMIPVLKIVTQNFRKIYLKFIVEAKWIVLNNNAEIDYKGCLNE